LVKRYRVPLHHTYLGRAIVATDVGRIRFALSHGQVPVAMHYTQLFHSTDVGVLSEVLHARKVDGVLPEADAGVTVQRTSDEGTVGSCLLPTRRVDVSQSAARRMGLWPSAPWRGVSLPGSANKARILFINTRRGTARWKEEGERSSVAYGSTVDEMRMGESATDGGWVR
jgi:hypothetical protein